jgi:MarR family transcriptional regulator, transcriptional regulator for hemolysin
VDLVAAAVETDRSPDLIFLLSQAAHALQTEMTAALEQVGVTPRMQCVLSRALRGEYTQKDLADQCALDKTTMVVTMDALEASGLAERRPSPTDRRARIIAVTDKGAELVERADAIIEGLYADVLSSLPEDERAPLVSALQRLMDGRLANPPVCSTTVRRPRSS